MWKKISIRWQLIALMTLALVLIQLSILSIDYFSDIKQRKIIAIEQADTLSSALQHDLVRAIIDPKADTFSDISFRVSGFESVMMLAVFNDNMDETFRYTRENFTVPEKLVISAPQQPVFSDRFLHIKQPLSVDNYKFGEIFFLIDLEQYNTGLEEQLFNKLIIFLFVLAIALPMAWWISKNYTRPFSALANAMKQAKVEESEFPQVETRSQNEIGVLYDGYNQLIKEITRTTRDLKHLGEHDSLTGLLNRYAIDRQISESLKDENHTSSVMLIMDVDDFKLVNDTAGHAAGDELLKQIGQVLTTSIPSQASVGRVGGDDFIILMPGFKLIEGISQAEVLIQTMSDFRFTWKEQIFTVSVCIGIVPFKPHEFTPQTLTLAADTAFYAAKAKGHNKLSIYHADDEKVQQYSSDVQTVAIVKDALQNGRARFELYAQAIVPLQKETDLVSYEILLRLKNADGDMVYPDIFLPTANRYQMMVDIDTYVLRKYLETATAHPEHLEKLAFVNINMGGSTLTNSDFQKSLRKAIEEFSFPWNKLVLEVTETSAVGNLAQASDFICYCRELGIRVALDDFGTGMASFEYLKHLPLDVVKIDGSFVRDMLEDPVDHAMVSYVNDISKLRGQETIAEFVEEKAHADELTIIGIDYGQGYYLEKPRPLAEWL